MSEEDDQNNYQQHIERQQIMNESMSHQVHYWVESLDNDGLENLSMIIQASIGFPGWGAQMMGIIQGERRRKFNRCPVCGNDHEKEHKDLVAEGTPIPGTNFRVGDAAAFDDQVANLSGRNFPAYLRLCHQYGVTSNVDQDGLVYCKNCNMPYPNLDDRMLKEPDDCTGCQVFASTGQKFEEPPK